MPEELWMKVCNIIQEVVTKVMPPKRNAKWLSKEGLQITRKESERQRRKGKIYTSNAEFQRRARRDKKPFLSGQCKEIEKNNRTGKNREFFKKLEILREYFKRRQTQ